MIKNISFDKHYTNKLSETTRYPNAYLDLYNMLHMLLVLKLNDQISLIL